MDENNNTTLLYGAWGDELKQKLTKTAETIQNPFKHMRNWVKSELMELNALIETISRKEGVEAARSKALAKIRDRKETIDKMNQGKFTFKGLFKNTSEKAQSVQTMLNQIAEFEKDVKNYEIIRNYLIIYLAEVAIPAFKDNKFTNYLAAMENFCCQEVENAKHSSACWKDFLDVIHHVQGQQPNRAAAPHNK